MKKPDSKKTYSNFKSAGARNNFERSPRSERSARPFTPKAPHITRPEKPVYKGKEARMAGATRTETRTSLYGSHTHAVKLATYKKTTDVPESKSLQSTSYSLKSGPDTSWGGVADWYNKHLETGEDTYHAKVIFPNVLRMLGDISSKKILDMACGQGIFAEQLRDVGGLVTGVDLSKQLIKIAEEKSQSIKQKGTHKVTYHVASADDMFMLKDKSFDIVVCILALQNIENLPKTIAEASRVLTEGGKLLFVLNHPSFRNPKQTFWGYNDADDTQYRRVDEYMSESHIKIDMTPGSATAKKFTVSFHRPLQVYVKALSKSGFAITRLEEWVSHKESERGPKQRAENKSRKEIPMFMCIVGEKVESGE